MSAALRSKYGSKQYPNLYRYPDSQNWVFKKYSSEKVWAKIVNGKPVEMRGREFRCSTGESRNAALAYKIGLEKYNAWLGRSIVEEVAESGQILTFGAFAGEILDKKLARPDVVFSKNSKRRTSADYGYLIKHFGHLRVDQMTPDRWQEHVDSELKLKPQKFYNRRKALMEIMLKADAQGILPREGMTAHELEERLAFHNPDAAEDHGDYLEPADVRAALREASREKTKEPEKRAVLTIKLLTFWMWRMGARPSEILQYRWDMIRFKEGPHGKIYIPAAITKTRRARVINLNSRVSRYLKLRKKSAKSPWIFPAKDPAEHIVEYRAEWDRIAAGAGLGAATIYWLRGSFITDALSRGYTSIDIGRYCDTSPKMIEKRYAKSRKSVMEDLAG